MALDLIQKSKNQRFIIFSVSLSVLTLIQSKKLDNPHIIKLKISADNEILLCWISSYTGISENGQVDEAARSALSMVPEKKNYDSINRLKNKNEHIHSTTKAASLEQHCI